MTSWSLAAGYVRPNFARPTLSCRTDVPVLALMIAAVVELLLLALDPRLAVGVASARYCVDFGCDRGGRHVFEPVEFENFNNFIMNT